MTNEAKEPEPNRFYGAFNADGAPQGFWVSEIFPPEEDGSRNKKIPGEAVELTHAQWFQLISNQPLGRFRNGEVVILEAPPPQPPPPNPLDAINATLNDLKTRIEQLEKK